jgi:hypothetical protein
MQEEEFDVAPDPVATEEDVAPEATAEPTDEPAEEGVATEDKPKTRHQRRRERFQKMEEERAAALQEAERERRRVKELEGLLDQRQPQESDFASYEEYQGALTGWHATRALDQRQKAQADRELQEREQAIAKIDQQSRSVVAQEWATQANEAKQRYADFEAVAYHAPISDGVSDMILTMDRGADVAYHLGLNPDTAKQISRLPPMQAAIELGRIEAGLSSPQPRTQTQAPDPVAPVRAKASAGKNPATMSMAEYAAARKAGKL